MSDIRSGRPPAAEVMTSVIADGEQVPVEDCRLSFSRDDYVQGSIELRINGAPIIRGDHTDTIDALWSLLLTHLEKFAAGEEKVFRFPERRYTLELKHLSGARLSVTFDDGVKQRNSVAPERCVLWALADGAVTFFGTVLKFASTDEWNYRRELNAAIAMRDRYSCSE